MHFQKIGQKYLIVLKKNEEIIQTLTSFCREQQVTNAHFSAIGALSSATIGYYELATKSYHWQDFSGSLEVDSLNGNVMRLNNEPFLHIHLAISNQSLQALGGHLKSGVVGVTLEVVLEILDSTVERKFNDEIGLNLIETE